jgi:DNA-binding transcriptional regulator LsrR (DeoR family)
MPANGRDKNCDDLAVALMFLDKKRPKDIAERLKIGIAEVSRSLARTRGLYWNQASAAAEPGLAAVSDQLMQRATARMQGASLPPIGCEHLMKLAETDLRHLRSVSVVQARCSLPEEADSKSWGEWMSEFARLAVVKLRPLLHDEMTVGVTWGGHLSALVDAITLDPDAVQGRRRAIRVLPLCGNRYGNRLVSESSSVIAERLGIQLAGEATAPGALILVPAFILGDLKDEDTIPLWMQVSRSEGYCEIFGVERIPAAARPPAPPATPWVHRLDAVLTSVSRDGHPFGYGVNRMDRNAGYSRELIESTYLGDIGGIGLVHPGKTALPIVEERWCGIRSDELRACAAKAAKSGNGGPGVIVVATGATRASSLIESVRQGLVSRIIMDESLNEELVQRWTRAQHRLKP